MAAGRMKTKSIFMIVVKKIIVGVEFIKSGITVKAIPYKHGGSHIRYITIINADAKPHNIVILALNLDST